MRKLVVFTSITLLMVSSMVSAQTETFEGQVKKLMVELLDNMPSSQEETRVYIQTPRYMHWGTTEEPDMLIGGGFRRYFQSCCESVIKQPFGLIPRDEFNEILEEMEIAQVREMSNPEKVVESIRTSVSQEMVTSLDAIIMLEFSIPAGSRTTIKTIMSLVDVQRVRKHVVAGTLRELSEEQVADAQSRPDNYDDIVRERENMSHVLPDDTEQFGLSVWMKDDTGGIYVDGEHMIMSVSAEEDCYIAVININAQGSANVLFPNRWEQDNHVMAGKIRQVPGPEPRPYDMVIRGPYGAEAMKVIASRTPFQVRDIVMSNQDALPGLYRSISDGAAYPSLGDGGLSRSIDTMRALTRSVVNEARESDLVHESEQELGFAEAQCFFRTVPASTRGLWSH